jgi:CheY-like chemotaxis protein
MPRLTLRCRNCSSQADADISATEDSLLRAQGFLTRFCNRCHGQTRWTKVEGGHGSTFRAESVAPPPPKLASVLAIDDDDAILAILSKALSQEDCEVEMANSARRAIFLLGRGDYDLILSDIRMPDFDGKQLFAYLEQNMREYKGKVIFLTGDAQNPETAAFLQQSGCLYLDKPINIPLLLAFVRKRLGK